MDHPLIKKLISYLLIASFFITGDPIASIGFDFYWYYIPYTFFLVYGILVYHRMHTKILLTLAALIVYSLLTYDYGLGLVIKQLVNIIFACLVFYNFILFERHDYSEIFRKFIQVSKVILIVGFIQVFLFSLHLGDYFLSIFPFLRASSITVRLQSLTQEPSFIAFLFSPIIFLSLYNLTSVRSVLINKVWSALFIVGYILTLSAVSFLGVFLMIVILYFSDFSVQKFFAGAIVIPALMIFSIVSYGLVSGIRLRVNDTFSGLVEGIDKDQRFREVNLSTYALLSNYYVTKQSFQQDPFTGTGLGTYELVYDKYIPTDWKTYFALNRKDANSMALRLLTETGILGLLVFCVFLFKYKIASRYITNISERILWLINAGIFIMLLLVLLRNGNYTVHGRILFLMLFYFTSRAFENEKDNCNICDIVA